MPNCSSKAVRQPVRQFFRRRHDHAQAAEISRRTAAQIKLQERRRGQEKCHVVFADERPDAFGIERIRVIDHADAKDGGQTQRAGETKRMEERQDAEKTIAATQPKHLLQLLDVRANVVMAQHHPLGIARAAAGENHCGKVVQAGFLLRAQNPLQPAIRHQPRDEKRGEFFT